MDTYNILGWIATILTSVYLVPQAIKAIKTKNTKSVSLYTMAILVIASSIWTVYGFIGNQPQIYVTNIIQTIFSLIIMIIKIIEIIKEKKQ